jgi:putative ABC transport system permease protein
VLLALGASRLEATQALVQRAVRVAMTPLLNQMSVMGLVSIPGMMTGQIMAGSDPATAARCAAGRQPRCACRAQPACGPK